jgi:hypothetical protein
VWVIVVSLAVRLIMAVLIARPGYMDAAYYAAGAVRIAHGAGFSEPFIWNYLNDPAGVPHPGFLYWMPLPSLLGALLAALFPGSFLALQVPFAVLSAVIPTVAYGLAWVATENRRLARAAGALALFSGFFFPYWTLPVTFTPFALFGSLALWLAGSRVSGDGKRRIQAGRWLSVGLLVGLDHLTRADGVLLLPVVALATLAPSQTSTTETGDPPGASRAGRDTRIAVKRSAVPLSIMMAGYALVMGPWFARNLAVVGTPLSSAGTKTIWLTEYDDLFCYTCDLSPSSYLAWGWDSILRSKLSALWINAQRFLAENCLVFLLPLVVIGFYRLHRHRPFLLALIYLVAIYLAHSLVFTFPGWRGGFFHASSAALPCLYAAAMAGLDTLVRWLARRRRHWRYQQAQPIFALVTVVGALILSGFVAYQRIPAWRVAHRVYEDADRWLTNQGAIDAGVMVRNPPAFWYLTHRPAIVIPNENVETLMQVADRYQMGYVLLEADHPAQLADLHAGAIRHPRLQVVKTWSGGEDILYAVQR